MASVFEFDWSRKQRSLYRSTFNDLESKERNAAIRDREIQEMFDKLYLNPHGNDLNREERKGLMDNLIETLKELGIDFEEDFDWEAFREYYDSISG